MSTEIINDSNITIDTTPTTKTFIKLKKGINEFTLESESPQLQEYVIDKLQNKNLSNKNLYKTALKNLFKKYNFLELNFQLQTEQITEEEFDKEILENEGNYTIKEPDTFASTSQVKEIVDFMKGVDKNLEIPVSEVEDIFQLKINLNALR